MKIGQLVLLSACIRGLDVRIRDSVKVAVLFRMAATTLQNTAFPARPKYTAAAPVHAEEMTSPFQRIGFNFLLIFLFLAFSRIFDVKFAGLHITGIAYRATLVLTFLSGAFKIALNTKIGRALLGFTICFGLSVPFSLWKGGSIPYFRDGWLMFSFVAFLATAGLVTNYVQTRKSVNALAWALFVFVIIANVFGTMDSGRLFLEQGKFANPNEMAQALLIGLPLWMAKMSETSSPFKKAFCVGVMLMMVMTVFRTGSRGAMIGLAVMMVFVFMRATVMGKMQMVLGLIFMIGLISVTMPGKLISRYKTIASDEVEDDEMDAGMRDSAMSSTQSRKMLLKNSIKFTIRHPLFGVGPGMFPVADDNEAHAQGLRKGQWLGTHNSYTQVSSELGVPAFCFFVATIVMATKGPYQLYRRTRDDPRTADIGSIALGLHYAMIVYAVTIFFEHIAYAVMLPVFAGMASALLRTSEAEIERRMAMPAPQNISAPMFRTYSRVDVTQTV
jgi:O-antigen ligase